MKLKKIFSFIFILVVLGAWIFYSFKYIDDISSSFKKINIILFLFASLFLIGVYFIIIFNWKYILKVMGFTITYLKASRIWFLSNLAKYIPGTIWVPLGRSIYTSDENISVPKTFLSWIIEIYLTLFSIVFFVSVIQFWYSYPISIWKGWPFLILFIFILPIFLNRYIISLIVFLSGRKRFKKFKNKFVYLQELFRKTKLRKLMLPFSLNIVIYLLYGIWLFFLAKSVNPLVRFSFFFYVFIWIVSWFVSYVVVFLPGGIGLREGILVLFLINNGFIMGDAIVISILTRIQYIIVDGLLGLAFLKDRKINIS